MHFTEQGVTMALAPHPVRFFESVGSTSDAAREWLEAGAAPGSVVVADAQTQGRGRKGRDWSTPPGVGIAVSAILMPPVTQVQRMHILGTLAVCDLLDALDVPDVGVKWPNDVQIRGRKVAGVLPEAIWQGDSLQGVVLGLGLNVRNNFGGTDLEQTATSIESEIERAVDRLRLLSVLLFRLEMRMDQPDAWMDDWRGRLSTLGQAVTVGDVSGIAQDVDDDGALLVKRNDEVVRVTAGDLQAGEQS